MKQHFKDQITYILDSFDFLKMRQMTLALEEDRQSPSVFELEKIAKRLLGECVENQQEKYFVETCGFRAEKIDGYRLRLYFIAESKDGTDVVGDEGL